MHTVAFDIVIDCTRVYHQTKDFIIAHELRGVVVGLMGCTEDEQMFIARHSCTPTARCAPRSFIGAEYGIKYLCPSIVGMQFGGSLHGVVIYNYGNVPQVLYIYI